ncbi:MAG: GxxExxY protein [Alphaproteobacteria bacterium]|nr:GxxExxY protein [Alphaproteobacteria bacterium]
MSQPNKVSTFPDLGADLTGQVIEASLEVHRELGPGLLESVYEACLYQELLDKGLDVEKQLTLPVFYKGRIIDQGFRLDLLVNKRVLVEVKACEAITPVHKAQILTYMRLSKTPVGLLINFNRKLLKDGIQRFALAEFDELQRQTELDRDSCD